MVVFRGMCDASGAAVMSETRFVVADDEANLLRVYDSRGGEPVGEVDVSGFLGLAPEGKKQRFPEIDLEAAATIGDREYWLSSHARDKKGRARPERLIFFATRTTSGSVVPFGRPYDGLLRDLQADPRLAAHDLSTVNIEGMTASLDGKRLFIGFRNPVIDGKALVVTLENPAELVESPAAVARFGAPMLIDFGGFGIRSLSSWRGTYLVVAGELEGGGSRLFTWDGAGAPRPVAGVSLAGFNIEGFFSPDSRERILLLSDDGLDVIGDRECKKLKDGRKMRFRGVWIDAAALAGESA